MFGLYVRIIAWLGRGCIAGLGEHGGGELEGVVAADVGDGFVVCGGVGFLERRWRASPCRGLGGASDVATLGLFSMSGYFSYGGRRARH